MKTSDFFYDLPQELIAQHGVTPRDHSRMLCMDRNTGELYHKHFYDIIDYLKEGDLLVMNNSRVIPARIYGIKKDTGADMEILLLEEKEKDVWEILVKPGKKAKVGAILSFGDGKLECEVLDIVEDGNRIVKFSYDGDFFTILDEIGNMPLPPYITEKLTDKERYQTVYSKELGSAAAPTAGLHFTPELLEKIKANGVKIAYVTLHVGLGTFRPVKAEKIEEHNMHTEHYYLPKETADLILKTKEEGGRVIAVGTTSCRTLEGAFQKSGVVKETSGDTNIFIYPGKKFNVIDGLITNFHLPESTLIMLVSAFAGYENTMNAYKIAVEDKYRFFSFGDAMCILPNLKEE